MQLKVIKIFFQKFVEGMLFRKEKESFSQAYKNSIIGKKKSIDSRIESLVNEGALTLTYVDVGKK